MQLHYECINYFSQLTVTLHTFHALFSPNAPLRSTVKVIELQTGISEAQK